MNEIIAYALLIFGVPIAIGGLIGLLFASLPDPISEAIDGITGTLLALGMFHLFKVKVTLIVPTIVAIVTIVWFIKRKEYKAIPWQIFGVATATIGYYLMVS